LYEILVSLMRATCPAHLIFLDVTTLMFGEAYNLWRFSLCSLLRPPANFLFLVLNILLEPCSQTTSAYVLRLESETKVPNSVSLYLY
jgi:hypothetical protein